MGEQVETEKNIKKYYIKSMSHCDKSTSNKSTRY